MAPGVLRVAAAQLAVGTSLADNIARARELIARAAAEGAQLVALPECFVGKYGVSKFASYREPVLPQHAPGGGASMLAACAKEFGVYLTGGIVEQHASSVLYNSMPVYGPDGELLSVYRKVHLSRVMGITSESDVLQPGVSHTKFSARAGSLGEDPLLVGMACCFDLRFPEWLSGYGPRGKAPVDVMLAPSAFLEVTGVEHWDLLIRRTALDAQCYVVAPNVAYDQEDDVPLHGRSAVVDPFGKVLAQCGAHGDDLAVADVISERIRHVRAKLPVTLWAQ
jgi:predicted amidohydrolase